MSPVLLDVLFVVCAVAALYAGYKRGLLSQAVWLVSSFVGLALAARLSDDLAELLGYAIGGKPVTLAVSFLLIFLFTIMLTRWIGRWLTDKIKQTPVGLVNSILGAVCSLGIFLIIASLVMVVSMVIVPGARTTVEQTTVLQGVLVPVKGILDDRLLHRGSDEEPPAAPEA